MVLNRQQLRQSAQSFCDAFASRRPLSEVLDKFSTREEPLVIEHGLALLAPFLGRTYTGLNGIRDYFETIISLLDYDSMRFSDYVVDEEEGKVSVRGVATFTWKTTGQSWHEVFTYTLAFDEELKVKQYEIWADSGAAYLASKGLLQ
jgi:hypothetical protein